MIQWSWFKFYTGKLPEPEETVISWDTASKKTELSDYSVGTVWGRFADQYVLLDLVRGKYAYPELKRVVTQTSGKYPNAKVLIEDAGSGTSLIQDLHADGVRVQAIRPLGDKIVRMSAQTARIEEGRVHLPESASWLEEFRSEVMAFPNGRHDDQVELACAGPCMVHPTEEADFGLRISANGDTQSLSRIRPVRSTSAY